MTPGMCAHSLCRCSRPYSAQTQAASTAPIDPEGTYCSRRCEEAAARGPAGDGGCLCGHPQCEPSEDTGIPPMQ